MTLIPVIGLELGSSKVVALVGRMRADGQIMIAGIGEQPSSGIRKGEVTDLQQAADCVRSVVEQAEKSAGVHIREVTLAVSGGQISATVNRGFVPVLDHDRGITTEDVEQVLEIARAVSLPPERDILHTLCQHFWVDDLHRVLDPVGMEGRRLSLDMLIVHSLRGSIRNTVRTVRSVPLEVRDVVFSGLCSALSVLTPDQKQRGAVVMDLGAGTTDYMAFAEGVPAMAGTVGVGTDHVTNDVAVAFQISLSQAEKLKRESGSARVEPSDAGHRVSPPPEVGFPSRPISLRALNTVIQLRMEELFQIIRRELERARVLHRLAAGIVLTGGGAHLRGVCELARDIFGLNAAIGIPRGISGLAWATEGPEYAACAGAVQYGFRTQVKEHQLPWWRRWLWRRGHG